MSNKKQRDQNRATASKLNRPLANPFICNNCKQYTCDGHFVPPSFGDKGGYICEVKP